MKNLFKENTNLIEFLCDEDWVQIQLHKLYHSCQVCVLVSAESSQRPFGKVRQMEPQDTFGARTTSSLALQCLSPRPSTRGSIRPGCWVVVLLPALLISIAPDVAATCPGVPVELIC